MGQITQHFARDMLAHCVRKERPPLTIWETEQLLRAWLQLDTARAVAAEQAEEDALWCIAESIEEAFFQQELRRLAAAVEGPNG
jgi:heme-degrading monooxygenase HmoA